ncbi:MULTISPECIES: hypothetical protein [unclassified Haloarcula]|uniref:hypothetical protein n=1 Tax=unclassified Haloarcula TaxID=2624677 RepID=UPI000EF21517|nr:MULTISPECIES: hypothetical protein [unclassified Haloarcula]RLM37212.1 hypothetical protein DVK01_11475 [Haloarcula sp. Atlit-120R]RLM44398.1 hypothetical protein DVK00_07985 [Haloarcula sp. Atlit-47R]
MSRTVNIEVYCDVGHSDEPEVFGVASEHRADLPKPFDAPLQEWVRENFSGIEKGDSIPEAGVMEYEPDGEIIEFRKTANSQ